MIVVLCSVLHERVLYRYYTVPELVPYRTCTCTYVNSNYSDWSWNIPVSIFYESTFVLYGTVRGLNITVEPVQSHTVHES